MSKYQLTGLIIAVAFFAAFYSAVVHDTADLWIVAAFAAGVVWAFAGLAKLTVYSE